MRLPRPHVAFSGIPWPVLAAVGAAVPPADLHAAFASAAGTLFEAAPFVLAAEVLPARHAVALQSVGCGCARRGVPGAASLPATALCWLAFGPWIALARLGAAVAIAVFLRRARFGRGAVPHGGPPGPPSRDAPPDPFTDLCALIVPTVAASLFAQTLGTHATGFAGVWNPLAIAAGACLGILVPCATAGVAIAAGLAHALPAAATGLLLTTGFIAARSKPRTPHAAPIRNAGFASVSLAFALAAIALRGPSGLVNPRLLPLDAIGAALALGGAGRRLTRARAAPLIGAALACAMSAGYAVPHGIASETTLDAAYAQERIEFTGIAYDGARGTVVQRFAIACCRFDATLVAVRLTRRLTLRAGTWVTLRGRFVRRGTALLVRPESLRTVPAPADPFVYR